MNADEEDLEGLAYRRCAAWSRLLNDPRNFMKNMAAFIFHFMAELWPWPGASGTRGYLRE